MIASGSLAARRTAAGALGAFDYHKVPKRRAVEMLKEAGLPARAYDAPDFPISLTQHLELDLALLKQLGPDAASLNRVFGNLALFDISRFGLVGLAMQHAPSLQEAMQVGLRHPELVWGHTRVAITRRERTLRIQFSMERPALPAASPAEIDRLVAHCVTQDLCAVVRMVSDIMGGEHWPDRIDLPFSRPIGWDPESSPAAAAVRFRAATATLIYPAALLEAVPAKANRISFLANLHAARILSETLSDEVSLAEQVSRWLWASAPPLKRGEIAELLGLSERSLARRLKAEGASYNRLLAEVQVERAKNLLRDRNATAASVAYRLGYSDPAAFSRAFAGWTGTPPAAWKAARDAVAR